ncbi:spore coat protein U domain-containing protein [Erwinia sp. S43]|uniref:Csu type fimbrial protein n=2 Tax=Erwinia TaxID=551 RepID=UPI0019092FEC|nr:spore coat protein U domain-containing protein [Erwinia sp. S43]
MVPDRINLFSYCWHLLTPLLLISGSGWSMPTPVAVEVKASIVNGCVVSGTNPSAIGTLNFGTLPGINSAATTASAVFANNTTITLACTPGTTLTMSIDGGVNYANSSRNMKIANNTNLVSYALYTNAAHTTAIPLNTALNVTYSSANNIVLPIYGLAQIPRVNRAGTYTDTLTVTLNW